MRPNFDPAFAHAYVEEPLGKDGWAVENASILQTETRSVPRAADTVPLDLSFGERPTEMRACLTECVDRIALLHEHDGYASGRDFRRLVLRELSRVQNGNIFLRRVLVSGGGMVDADLLAVRKMPSQKRGRHRHAERGHRESDTPGARPAAQQQRGRIEAGRGQIHDPVRETDSFRAAIGLGPVSRAGDRCPDRADKSDLDRGVRQSAIAMQTGDLQRVENCGQRPGADGKFDQSRMQRMSESTSVKKILGFAPGSTRRGEERSNRFLQWPGDPIERFLIRERTYEIDR